jgi:large repetitive protein
MTLNLPEAVSRHSFEGARMRSNRFWRGLVLGVLLLAGGAYATPTTWTGDGNWTEAGNWSEGVPGAGVHAVIASGNCEIDASTTIGDLTVSAGATLTFSGWNTILTANDVTVDGTVTHFANTAIEPDGEGVWHPDMRIQIECDDLTVNNGGKIDADGKGYGYNEATKTGYGPGGGGASQGASHGAVGANDTHSDAHILPAYVAAANAYGVAEAPIEPGSGGGGSTTWHQGSSGGLGGGAIRIQASGTVTVSGTGSISANGATNPLNAVQCGGSGGSVYLICNALAGDGMISARGSNGSGTAFYSRWQNSGFFVGGAGGRIAIYYDDAAQDAQNAVAPPAIIFSAHNGRGNRGGALPGTVYFSGDKVLHTVTRGGYYRIEGVDSWSPASLSVTGGFLQFPEGFALTVANDLNLTSGGALRMHGGNLSVGGNLTINDGGLRFEGSEHEVSTIDVGGNLAMSNNAGIYFASKHADGAPPNFGVVVTVGGHLTVPNNCHIFPQSDRLNGSSVRMEMGQLTVASGGSFSATQTTRISTDRPYSYARGYPSGQGPGAGGTAGGGGHGGVGGMGMQTINGPPIEGTAGTTYDIRLDPVEPGSGGGNSDGRLNGGYGGGVIHLTVDGIATINGDLNANGGNAFGDRPDLSGAGSGGSINLRCDILAGATGRLLAGGGTGGSNHGGGGGGGLIAVRYRKNFTDPDAETEWANNVAGGMGSSAGSLQSPGADGFITFIGPPSGTMLLIR